MVRKTEPARIITWVNKSMPKRIKIKEFFDQVRKKVEEVITNNLSQGKRPISFYSVQRIFEYYKQFVYEQAKYHFPENVLYKELDEIVREELDEIYNKYYRK